MGKARLFGIFVLNAIPAIIIPLITAHYNWFSKSDSVVVGILIWIGMTCGLVLEKITVFAEADKRAAVLWDAFNSFEAKLSNVRKSYRRILSSKKGSTDLFESFFGDKLSELEAMIKEAAERGELHLDRRHIVSLDVLLASFRGDKEDLLRAVHFVEDTEFMFKWGHQYFSRIHALVQQKKVKEVRRLMVYRKPEDLTESKTARLIRFHAINDGYDYKIMSMDNFRSVMFDYKVECPRDFGIYGNYYVYRAVANQLDNITGHWLNSPEVVTAYTEAFDACWRSPAAREPNVSAPHEKMSLSNLFAEEQP